jgi:catechol 2,3-dioxygenase-like lactoylglutathione lyase family enzyme
VVGVRSAITGYVIRTLRGQSGYLSVGDISARAGRGGSPGGTTFEESDMKAAIIIRDPDGQLIELMSSAFLEHRPPGSS